MEQLIIDPRPSFREKTKYRPLRDFHSKERCIARAFSESEFRRTGKWPKSIMISCPCSKCSPARLQ